MGDLEYTQYFDEGALPGIVTLDDVKKSSNGKGNEYVEEGCEK